MSKYFERNDGSLVRDIASVINDLKVIEEPPLLSENHLCLVALQKLMDISSKDKEKDYTEIPVNLFGQQT